jgi:hypothetical protein
MESLKRLSAKEATIILQAFGYQCDPENSPNTENEREAGLTQCMHLLGCNTTYALLSKLKCTGNSSLPYDMLFVEKRNYD